MHSRKYYEDGDIHPLLKKVHFSIALHVKEFTNPRFPGNELASSFQLHVVWPETGSYSYTPFALGTTLRVLRSSAVIENRTEKWMREYSSM